MARLTEVFSQRICVGVPRRRCIVFKTGMLSGCGWPRRRLGARKGGISRIPARLPGGGGDKGRGGAAASPGRRRLAVGRSAVSLPFPARRGGTWGADYLPRAAGSARSGSRPCTNNRVDASAQMRGCILIGPFYTGSKHLFFGACSNFAPFYGPSNVAQGLHPFPSPRYCVRSHAPTSHRLGEAESGNWSPCGTHFVIQRCQGLRTGLKLLVTQYRDSCHTKNLRSGRQHISSRRFEPAACE
jgi:hypothetical protein